jgi:hypothetical protein
MGPAVTQVCTLNGPASISAMVVGCWRIPFERENRTRQLAVWVSTDGTLVAGRAIRPQRYPKISVDIQNFP